MIIDNLIIKVLETLAWPVTVIIIVVIFRKQIGRAILTVSKLKYKDLELEFDKRLQDAEREATQIQLSPPQNNRDIKELLTSASPYDRLFQLADISPRSAIIEAWLIVESITKDVAKKLGITAREPRVGRELIRELVKDNKLREGTTAIYDNLRTMRNSAAHALEFEISAEDAKRYVDLAISLAHRLRMTMN